MLTNGYNSSQGKWTKGNVLLLGKKKKQQETSTNSECQNSTSVFSTSVKTVISKTMIRQFV